MWNRIDNKLLQINKAAGIEILFLAEGKISVTALVARIADNTIIKETAVTGLSDVSVISKTVSKNIPLHLVLNGQGIVTRKQAVETSADQAGSSFISNANPDTFYQCNFSNDHLSVTSIARKETVDSIFTSLQNEGFKIISLSLGISPLNKILDFLTPGDEKVFSTASYRVKIADDKQLVDFTPRQTSPEKEIHESEEYLVANQYVRPWEVLPFSAAVELIADNIKVRKTINCAALGKAREDYRYYRYFNAAGLTGLLLVFFILLTSFLFYTYYFNANQKARSSSLANSTQHKAASAILKTIQQKEKFLNESGWNTGSRVSYFADRIAALIPAGVQLTSMNLFPAKSSFQAEGTVFNYKKDTIQVSGTCNDPISLTRFINAIQLIKDFKKASVKNYQYIKENDAALFQVELITN